MDQKLADELEAARANRAEKIAKREAEAAEIAARRELADLAMLETLEAEHGAEGDGLARVAGRNHTVFVKRPHHSTYAKFSENQNPDFAAIKQFVWPCIVSDKAEADAAIKAEPHLLLRLASAVAVLGGAAATGNAGK